MNRNTTQYRWLAGIALIASLAIFAACGSDNAADTVPRGPSGHRRDRARWSNRR